MKFLIPAFTIIAISSAQAHEHADDQAIKLESIERFFETAQIIEGPEILDCTLSGGAKTQCFSITVKSEPSNYTPGPWCPSTATSDDGGIWLDDGKVHNVDGKFISDLGDFYNDSEWSLVNDDGTIKITDTLEACQGAAKPNVEAQYQNHCVQCELAYMPDDASMTYVIPLVPVPTNGANATLQSGSGVAFNGVRFDAAAPVDAILSAHTLAPFDECGGHVNLHVGYHYHAVTECLTEGRDNRAAPIGMAMDGFLIYAREGFKSEELASLDQCNGRETEGLGYHYVAGEAGSNAILGCLKAQAGCALVDGGICDASATTRGGPGGGDGPDFSEAATKLGISAEKLISTMQQAGGRDADLAEVAKMLEVNEEALRAALPTPPSQ